MTALARAIDHLVTAGVEVRHVGTIQHDVGVGGTWAAVGFIVGVIFACCIRR